MEYLKVEQARDLPGLRLVLTRGVPNPWGEFAKGVFRVKDIPFTACSQLPGEPNEALREWTGQTSGPAAVYEDQPPRTSWGPILHLAQRLAPTPSLLPADEEDRVRMLGLCEEIAGEDGLGWNRRRLAMIEWAGTDSKAPMNAQGAERIRKKYGDRSREHEAELAIGRMEAILVAMGRQAEAMKSAGHRYLIGGRLSALDVMWAGFAGLLDALPETLCPMPEAVRTLYTIQEPRIRVLLTPALLGHRDFMYSEHLPPPTHM